MGQAYVRGTNVSGTPSVCGTRRRHVVDKSWTIMNSVYSHLQGGGKNTSELKTLIRPEVAQQERLEAMGYR